jgi:hypothetical protein
LRIFPTRFGGLFHPRGIITLEAVLQIRIAVENGNDGRSLAWALDHPGCFIYAPDESTAILSLPRAYLHYAEWVSKHTSSSWAKTGSIDIRLVEVWQCYYINAAYQIKEDGIEIDAWFRDDWRPLSKLEIDRGKQLLGWSREDLMSGVQTLSPDQLGYHAPGVERWTIYRILGHIANAEWWYLDRLGLAPWDKNELPEDPFTRLKFVRQRVMGVLDTLAGKEIVTGLQGEFWSPRKMLRRLLYHERDHHGHLLQILTEPH